MRKCLLGLFLILLFEGATASAALAQTPAPQEPDPNFSLSVRPRQPLVIDVRGVGLKPGSKVIVFAPRYAAIVRGTRQTPCQQEPENTCVGQADADGEFSFVLEVNDGTRDGRYQVGIGGIRADGVGLAVTRYFWVLDGLPRTGIETGLQVGIGVTLITVGFFLVKASSRMTTPTTV